MKIDKEALRWIEANLVMPFEGTLQSKNEDAVRIHKKITDYNREKFNKLIQMFTEKKKKDRQATFRTFTEDEVLEAIKTSLYTTCDRDAHKSYAYVDYKGYKEFAELIKSNLGLE